jgi:hypothetical protein
MTDNTPPGVFEIEYTYLPFDSKKIGEEFAGRDMYTSTLGEVGLATSTTATDEFV